MLLSHNLSCLVEQHSFRRSSGKSISERIRYVVTICQRCFIQRISNSQGVANILSSCFIQRISKDQVVPNILSSSILLFIDKVKDGLILIEYIVYKVMIVDLLTKFLVPKVC